MEEAVALNRCVTATIQVLIKNNLVTKEEFLENMKALDGIELESYFKSNGWIISDTDLAICISQKYIETLI